VGLGGGVEANPGPVSQAGDPLGPQHRRKGAKHARETPGWHNRHPVDDGLAPGDLGAVDGHDWQHTTWGSARTRATWSASNSTARSAGASG
jgi:hypothetical protein